MDAALLVVDLCDPACLEQVENVRTIPRERRVTLTDRWEPAAESPGVVAEGDEDPFALRLPTLLVANKVELEDSTGYPIVGAVPTLSA